MENEDDQCWSIKKILVQITMLISMEAWFFAHRPAYRRDGQKEKYPLRPSCGEKILPLNPHHNNE